jgi:putative selenate reductase FAD-binding subunit
MITEYHRPKTLAEALTLISRPDTYPLGGGTWLNLPHENDFAVVDLQDLGLDQMIKRNKSLEIGATTTLQELLDNEYTPPGLKIALSYEKPLNLRNMATIGGNLVVANGRSPLTTILLALDVKIHFAADTEPLAIGNFLPLKNTFLPGKLITKIEVPLDLAISFEKVSKTPSDNHLVCVALAHWHSDRTRVALGGWGTLPLLAMDSNELNGSVDAARNAYSEAGDDLASAEYRSEMAAELTRRCIANMKI